MRRRQAFGGRLDRYVGTHFAASYALVAGLLVGLFIVLDAASHLEGWMEESSDGPPATLLQVLKYYSLSLPYIVLQVAPFATLMAAMFTVNKLLRKNEIAPILSAGVSAHRTLLPVYLAALLMATTMIGLREVSGRWIAGSRDSLYHQLEERQEEVEYHGVIVRNLDGSWAILERYLPDAREGPTVFGLTVKLREDGRFTKIEAPWARWEGGHWRLLDGLRTELVRDAEVRSAPVSVLEGVDLSPDLVETYRRAKGAPMELTLGEVSTLLQREPDQPAWATLWHYHLTFALANLILVLVGVPLMFNHERSRGTERLALGGLLCVFYFALDFVLRTLGLNGSVSPVLASWAPVLAFGTVGVFLTEAMRT
jgi:lipopolysaccharide export system permease protein